MQTANIKLLTKIEKWQEACIQEEDSEYTIAKHQEVIIIFKTSLTLTSNFKVEPKLRLLQCNVICNEQLCHLQPHSVEIDTLKMTQGFVRAVLL